MSWLMTFQRFRAIAERLGIVNLAAFATAAVREAENRDAFVAEAEEILGHEIRVLSGQEEANIPPTASCWRYRVPTALWRIWAAAVLSWRGSGSVTEKWATLPLGVLALREYSKNSRAEMSKIIEAA